MRTSNDRHEPEADPAPNVRVGTALPYARHKRSIPTRLLIFAGVIAGLVLMFAIREWQRQPSLPSHSPPPAPSAPSSAELAQRRFRVERREHWIRKVQPRLQVCDEACAAGIDDGLQLLTRFMSERKSGSRPFAEAMLTLKGKWVFVRSTLPWWLGGDEDAYRQYVQEQFAKNIFSSEEMKTTIEKAVVTYLSTVQAAENELLVKARADLADIPLPVFPDVKDDQAFSSPPQKSLDRRA